MKSETQDKKPKFSLAYKDARLFKLVQKTDKKILAQWAIDCTKRGLHYFKDKYPTDQRPKIAIQTLKNWIKTGIFKMKVIRKAALDSHAAAREIGEDNAARSAARAAGQTVATAHVKTHSIAAANYSLQAIYRSTRVEKANVAIIKERTWQYKHLRELSKIKKNQER
ncbi:hypothetical protein HY990_01955 [Candidatus Micrarchaeota archaeon]|nr:hypothetical protein [Candidatus Micrarchaeota archaeon]